MSNKYWTDKEDNKNIISANDFNSAFDGIATDMSNKADTADIPSVPIKSISVNDSGILPDSNGNVDIFNYAFDGSITVDVLSDKINCPRTIGLFKVVSSANVGFCGILYSSGMTGGATVASKQIIIMPRGVSLSFIKIRNWDATANQWSAWDIIKPKSTETPTIAQPCALNTIYSINQTSANSSVVIVLPEGGVGDFIQYDFVTGTTAPTVTVQSTYGMTEFDFTPEASKIYSLFFDWGIIAVENSVNVYGWRISYAEYDYTPSTAETTGNDTVVKANDDDL